MTDVNEVLQDLVAEQAALDAVLAPLDAAGWATATPSPRWSVADQIGHLTYFDTTAALAIVAETAFVEHRDVLLAAFADELAVDQATLGDFRQLDAEQQLAAWRAGRAQLDAAGQTLSNDTRVEWYGPSMGSKSFLTARLMEVWAHGQDICDVVGAEHEVTDRIRHITQLGVITRGWSYMVRGERAPEEPVAVNLTAPSGANWTWGEGTASIEGSAEDFCLVVTQRRHLDDTGLVTTGTASRDWMLKAQAFAGTPTTKERS